MSTFASKEVIARRIRRLRDGRGLKQQQLAEQIGRTQASVCDWERGRYTPDRASLEALATFFDVSVAEIVFDDEPARGER